MNDKRYIDLVIWRATVGLPNLKPEQYAFIRKTLRAAMINDPALNALLQRALAERGIPARRTQTRGGHPILSVRAEVERFILKGPLRGLS